MDDVINCNTKTFGTKKEHVKIDNGENPIKQVYGLDGKFLIVIDKSIAEYLKFDTEKTELFFRQEATEDGCIILSPLKLVE